MPDREITGAWGVLGGAFDPVHHGHLELARGVQLARHLSGVLFVPSFRHPLKEGSASVSYSHRVAMARLAIAGQSRFLIEEIEAEQDLPGYTLDTMRALKAKYPRATLSFIIGADLVTQLAQWHDPERLFAETQIIVGTRPGFRDSIGEAGQPSVDHVEAGTTDISSTQIRSMIRSGAAREQLLRLLPAAVLDYIEKEQLYQ